MSGLPKAVREAEVQIGSVTLKVIHLDNGERLIEAESLAAFMAAMGDGTLLLSAENAATLAKAIRS